MKQIKTLVPMTQFVLQNAPNFNPFGSDEQSRVHETIHNYAKFLTTPLRLGFFIPCTLDDVPLSEPKRIGYLGSEGIAHEAQRKAFKTYTEAQSRCLFEGFTFEFPNTLVKDKKIVWFGELKGTIESLVYAGYELTPTAIQEIYGR